MANNNSQMVHQEGANKMHSRSRKEKHYGLQQFQRKASNSINPHVNEGRHSDVQISVIGGNDFISHKIVLESTCQDLSYSKRASRNRKNAQMEFAQRRLAWWSWLV